MTDERSTRDILWAERCVQRRLHLYGHCIDAADVDGWLDCFTDDGVFRAAGTSELAPVFEISGQEALRSFITRHARRPADLVTQHVVLQSVVDVADDLASATARSYFMVLNGVLDGPTSVRMFGTYADRLVRGADGEWRLSERSAVTKATHSESRRLDYLAKS